MVPSSNKQETVMNTRNVEINILSEDELNAVAGGWKDDPHLDASRLVALGPIIANSKGMDTTGGLYAGNTATTSSGPLPNPLV
jgi:hypothetical protein